MVDRCGGQPGLDQLDSSAVDYLVVRGGRDGHGPAEVMGDADSHASNLTMAGEWDTVPTTPDTARGWIRATLTPALVSGGSPRTSRNGP
jgi:hypothetical protein